MKPFIQRITPELITTLPLNAIFVFASNESGRHGAGAARDAIKWGAIYGKPFGMQGRTFAIPTKGPMPDLKLLPLHKIGAYANAFWSAVIENPYKDFFVTSIGCGLAGYTPEQIAPLFYAPHIWHTPNSSRNNFSLPKRFWDVINKMDRELDY